MRCRSSRTRSSPSGRAIRSRSGHPRRCRTWHASAWPRRSRSPKARFASSFRTSAAVSAASASSTTRPTSLHWPGRPAGRCGWCSRAGRSSWRPIVAGRARVILDNGAYGADAPFFPQLAAMMAVGPYKVENVFVDASLAYTNTTPSGSVRAPTAPQACWAVEQHMDAVASKLGMDPVEFRRRAIVHEGDEGPTRQVFQDIGAAETLERAVELIGYGRDLPPDEAIGVAVGWWPSFGIASGAYVKINGDGSGTIITGAQECGTGAVMALPLLTAEVVGMRPDGFSIRYHDTDAGPFDL